MLRMLYIHTKAEIKVKSTMVQGVDHRSLREVDVHFEIDSLFHSDLKALFVSTKRERETFLSSVPDGYYNDIKNLHG